MFKIISVGWQCTDWIEQTLRSVENQTVDDWEIYITYDPSDDDGQEKIAEWCEQRGSRWNYRVHTGLRQFAVRNQCEAIQFIAPADDDIIVFLDLDGDQLAHPDVLRRLQEHYSDDTLLTYGNYRPIPYAETCPAAVPFPPEVVADNSYRRFILNGGSCSFNHLRTMKGKVAKAIPEESFKWPSGAWYLAGIDYVFMISGLELARGRYKCIEETLLLYNNANPHADYLDHPATTSACVTDFLGRLPLSELPH